MEVSVAPSKIKQTCIWMQVTLAHMTIINFAPFIAHFSRMHVFVHPEKFNRVQQYFSKQRHCTRHLAIVKLHKRKKERNEYEPFINVQHIVHTHTHSKKKYFCQQNQEQKRKFTPFLFNRMDTKLAMTLSYLNMIVMFKQIYGFLGMTEIRDKNHKKIERER